MAWESATILGMVMVVMRFLKRPSKEKEGTMTTHEFALSDLAAGALRVLFWNHLLMGIGAGPLCQPQLAHRSAHSD